MSNPIRRLMLQPPAASNAGSRYRTKANDTIAPVFSLRRHSRIRLGQQRLDGGFGLGVGAFTDVLIAKAPAFVDQVQRRPVVVVVGAPGRAFVVLRHSVRHAETLDRSEE